jgi:hypothetical protein
MRRGSILNKASSPKFNWKRNESFANLQVEIFNNFNLGQQQKLSPFTPIVTPVIRKESIIEIKDIFTR